MTDIEKVTIENATEQLKAKIRTAFVELLTPEQFRELVQAELTKFLKPSPETRDRYGTILPTKPAAIEGICRDVFTEHAKAEVAKFMSDPDMKTFWSNGQTLVGKYIREWLTENRGALLESTVMMLAGQAAQGVINNMPR